MAGLGEERLKYLTEDQKVMSSILGYGFKFVLKTRVIKKLVLYNKQRWIGNLNSRKIWKIPIASRFEFI